MTADLGDLYQEVILDHNRRPRNFRKIETASHRAVGHNPLCGDKIAVYVHLEGDRIRDISFEGSGCAISKASASLMTESVKGRGRAEVEELFRAFHGLVTGEPGGGDGAPAEVGKLVVLGGVREYPVRVKCATLAWHTLRAALEDRDETTTE
ncbi:MAG: Fe-S cluster assembly sulfur transfer protein SufU [Acidobacteriota bacterium]